MLSGLKRAGGKVRGRTGERLKRVHPRGAVSARFAGAQLSPRARRVVVKLRLVRGVSKSAMGAHLRYIERDGVMRDGAPGQAYGRTDDATKVSDFGGRCVDDRHHFRLIVAPEDATELEDLRTFTRQFMRQMEVDLQTRLDWVAVDHWDTANPHTHIALRGKDAAGENLVIDREYISHGMRNRASELATEWLGLRTEREIRRALEREVSQERWTGLDRMLVAYAADGQVSLETLAQETLPRRELLVGRLQALENMGLVQRVHRGRWQVSATLEPTLRALGERGDIVRTMQRAFTLGAGDFAMFDPQRSAPVVGRVAAKGLGGEFADQPYIVIDGSDGRAHYVRLHGQTEVEQISVGQIYEVRAVTERGVDRNIARATRDGLYRTDQHLKELRARCQPRDAQEIVDDHVRRLEALRRAGIVERVAAGVWRVPADLPQRGLHYDQHRSGTTALHMRSHLSLQQQVRAMGATWLDQQLVGRDPSSSVLGFGSEVRNALVARSQFLIEQGLAQQQGERIVVQRNLLSTLRQRELDQVGKAIATETGAQYRVVAEGARAAGVYRRSLMLASGRFALLEDGRSFSLVPWRPVIEAHLGRHIAAVIGKDRISWELGRGLAR